MSNEQFGLILLFLGITYGSKDTVSRFINKKISVNTELDFKFKSDYVSYILFIILSITLVIGMLSGEKIVKNYGNVSDGFENVKPKDMDRPNPLFDIDTYW